MSLPTKLTAEPVLEAVWEIRFSSPQAAATEILLGVLIASFKLDFPKVERLPASAIPAELRDKEPNLRYVPTIRMVGPQFTVLIGDRLVALSCARPYAGWTAFREKIVAVLRQVLSADVLGTPERFSLKYVDVLGSVVPTSLTSLRLSVLLDGEALSSEPMDIRFEIKREGFLNIIHVAQPANVQLVTGEAFSGLLVDVDTVRLAKEGASPTEFCDAVERSLDEAHAVNKTLFFRSLLKPETIEAHGPIY